MRDKKHIDRLFQEKFKDFEKTPTDAVWSNIETKLNEKKKRRVIPIWWRYAGVAAILLLLLTVGNRVFNPSSNTNSVDDNQHVVDIEKTQSILEYDNSKNGIKNSNNIDNTSVIANTNLSKKASDENELESASSKNESTVNTTKKASVTVKSALQNRSEVQNNNSLIANTSKKSNTTLNTSLKERVITNSNLNKIETDNSKPSQMAIRKPDDAVNNKVIKTNNAIAKPKNTVATTQVNDAKTNNIENLVDDTVKNDVENNTETIEDVIAKNNEDLKEEKHFNRWSVAPNAAPVYFNTLGEGSSIGGQFNTNNKTGEVNMSYGINASYAINKKLSVRSGINRVNLGYNTNNVAVFDRANATTVNTLSSLKQNQSSDVVNRNIETDVSLISAETVKTSKITPEAFSTASSANINQSLGFIEVPVEFQYIVSDKKMGLNVIGGFSSFFLNSNELFSETNDSRTLIGEAVNVNRVSYSANFGLGLHYKMTKKINFNFEPMFKYQINTFNNTSGDFKPFFIGVYTGVGFKF